MSDWIQHFRQAFRSLRRTPGFSLIAVCTLGLAIGATAGIFSVVNTVLIDPLPYAETDRLVTIGGTAPGTDMPEEFPLAFEFFVHFQENAKALEDISVFNGFTSTLRAEDRIERVSMSAPSHSLFTTLGAKPVLGRLPTAEDGERVVVLSHQLWTTWFGADPDVLGKVYYVSGEDREVIGVMGHEFWFPSDNTLLWWFPEPPEEINPGRFGAPFVARLAPGESMESLRAELKVLAGQLPDRFGTSAQYQEIIDAFQPVIYPLQEQLLGGVAGPLWILLASMAIVLLVACANVANLFMVRAERRQSDAAVRRAFGAGRAQLVMTQLAEAMVVAAAAGILAVLVARAGVALLVQAAPPGLPRLDAVSVGPTVWFFTFGLGVLAALLCGLTPAWRFASASLSSLREGGRGNTRQRHWGRQALVVGQTSLALVLLIGSALLLRSFGELRGVNPGYNVEDVFTFQFAPEGEHLNDAPSYARLHTDFMERLKSLPGVERVGIINNVPLDEGMATRRVQTERTAEQDDAGTLLSINFSAGDYFETMGIQVLQGRPFRPEDQTTQLGNVLVSRSAAQQLWPGQDPIGKRLRVEESEYWETVVGVVDDVIQNDFRQEAEAVVYFPLVGQDPENRAVLGSPAYVVKTGRADEIAPEVRSLVREVAPTAPMYRVYTMEGLAERSMVQLSFTALTLGIASALALILGLVGLYGVLSYAVAERTKEIGLRMALGAAASQVRAMIVGQGARVLAVGIALGLGLALLASRALESMLFQIDAFDLTTYVGVSAVMVVVGLAATFVPAWRASRVDPMESLRNE